MKRVGISLLFALGLFGCESVPEIDDLCARVATCEASTPEQEQAVFDECVVEGDIAEEDAYQYDCQGELNDYLWCIDDAECDWWYECEEERDEFDSCIGGLPPD